MQALRPDTKLSKYSEPSGLLKPAKGPDYTNLIVSAPIVSADKVCCRGAYGHGKRSVRWHCGRQGCPAPRDGSIADIDRLTRSSRSRYGLLIMIVVPLESPSGSWFDADW